MCARAAAWIAALAVVPSAGADGLRIAPLQANLGPRTPTAQFEVLNDGSADATLDAHVFGWSQLNGQDVLAATDAVAVVPPVFRVAPGKKQVLRAGLVNRAIAGDPVERAYRLVLTEVPRSDAAPNTLRFQMRILIPLFVATGSAPPPALSLQLRGDAKRLFLVASNSGRVHVKISAVTLHDRQGGSATRSVLGYVLPGASMSIAVPGEPGEVPIVAAEALVVYGDKTQPDRMPVEVH